MGLRNGDNLCTATDKYVKNGLRLKSSQVVKIHKDLVTFYCLSQLCQSGVLETSQEYWNCVLNCGLSDQEYQSNIKSVIVSKSPRIGADNSDNYLVRFV